jgi:hypothetical protein
MAPRHACPLIGHTLSEFRTPATDVRSGPPAGYTPASFDLPTTRRFLWGPARSGRLRSGVALFLHSALPMIRKGTLSSVLFLLGPLAGCESYLVDGGADGLGGGPSSGGGATVQDSCAAFYEDFEPQPDVSFREDLVPVLQSRCNTSICHGGEHEKAQAGLWLGPDAASEPTAEDLWFVYRTLVDVQSTVAPQLALVRPGHAGQSYFMRKLDDCHDPVGLDCTLDPDVYGSVCGMPMPILTGQLSEAERDLFRSWIESGAPEN